jgi:hypothetical protein
LIITESAAPGKATDSVIYFAILLNGVHIKPYEMGKAGAQNHFSFGVHERGFGAANAAERDSDNAGLGS